jgi:maltooligosyltrehalose trehalohydrolase
MGLGTSLSLGALPVEEGRTHFRVWAPGHRAVEVLLQTPQGPEALPLREEPHGYFAATHAAPVGTLYQYRLDGGAPLPDPCSRFQPRGPHGPSQVVDPRRFVWSDQDWKGPRSRGQVLYELHVGTFTPEGTYAGVASKLPLLKELGVTTVELMPLHTFPGHYNWGYDSVSLFAPCAVYGDPDDLRRMVDAAHRLGISVILDVVYNHLGPDGNYLARYSRNYFNPKYPNEWGDPTNFDGEDAGASREFFLQNAAHWVSEYHLDGLRLDATQSLHDASPRHIITELVARTREAAGDRSVLLIAENEPQDVKVITPVARGGHGADGLWVDDFHHSARVAAVGRPEAYLTDYQGTAQELLSCVLRNSLYQGQYYRWQKKRRGSPLGAVPAEQVVFYLQNHDQLANMLRGERLHALAGRARARALTTFFLLLPQTPMLFMGQEFFASTPFHYFVDHHPGLQPLVQKGRDEFLSQFASAGEAMEHEHFHMPIDEEAFRRSKLDWGEQARHHDAVALHRDLLKLRREDPVFAAQDLSRVTGAVLGPQALVLRYSGSGQEGDRLVFLNLGTGLDSEPCPEPLLAPPPGGRWRMAFSSEATRYGGMGTPPIPEDGRLPLPGQAAFVLTTEEENKA